jgi:hypothetical protein
MAKKLTNKQNAYVQHELFNLYQEIAFYITDEDIEILPKDIAYLRTGIESGNKWATHIFLKKYLSKERNDKLVRPTLQKIAFDVLAAKPLQTRLQFVDELEQKLGAVIIMAFKPKETDKEVVKIGNTNN